MVLLRAMFLYKLRAMFLYNRWLDEVTAMFQRLRQTGEAIKRELSIYRAVARDPRTPRLAKWCLVAAVGYAVLPFDLIPDFVPVIGHVDDVVVIPALVMIALWLAPADVVAECRAGRDFKPQG